MRWLNDLLNPPITHSELVVAMKQIESPQKPPIVRVLTPRRDLTIDWWLRTYAPDHERTA